LKFVGVIAGQEVLGMPVYVYKCDSCGTVFERRQSVGEPALSQCPECEGRLRRVFQPAGIVFKGSGFYTTDNRRAPSEGKGESSSESKGSSED
jgi:putative FmdB family regulatory protein